jgi:hypothetical protein
VSLFFFKCPVILGMKVNRFQRNSVCSNGLRKRVEYGEKRMPSYIRIRSLTKRLRRQLI